MVSIADRTTRRRRAAGALWRVAAALAFLSAGPLSSAQAAPPQQDANPPIVKVRGEAPEARLQAAQPATTKQWAGYTDLATLLLPDLQTLPPTKLDIRMVAGNRRMLRLANTVWNSGAGPLELQGRFNNETGRTAVDQVLYAANGEVTNEPVGEFIFHIGHDHFHIEDFASYNLWALTEGGTPAWVAASSSKLSYCVIDTDSIDPENPAYPDRRQYLGCGRTLQGMSPGWGDEYDLFLEGQSLDITGLADGLYALTSTTNPDRRLRELDYTNNTATIYLALVGRTVVVVAAPEAAREPCLVAGWC
jgi:hypothetical protein